MTPRSFVCAALATLAFACGGPGDDDGTNPPIGDEDADGISDADEGAATNTDTDGDGQPDYQDSDSDGDGIEDYREAGDTDPGTRPVDTDNDGTPDFRDLDADGNGVPDMIEGTGDIDGDGLGDFQDPDNDGDFIGDQFEIGNDANNPVDTDGDGTPDYRDTDADNDTIPDQYESTTDFDMDGVGNWRDTDSDDDCRPDMLESGGTVPPRDTDGDQRYDFIDRDSDDDGIADRTEDTNCNGVRDGAETDAGNADTDGDGVNDLVEEAAGTNPNNPADNPQANGDFVFIVPYQDPPSPMDDDLDFATALNDLDVYVIVDRSGSMSTETNTIKNNLGTVINNLQCPPFGNGAPGTCIANLYSGLGAVGYTSQEPFRNYLDIQNDPNFAGQNITNVNTSPTTEPLTFGAWAAITGMGTAASGCSGFTATTANRSGCAAGTFGYPCFRSGSLPVVVMVTDEPPLTGPPVGSADTYTCPSWATTRTAYLGRSAKIMGVYGSGSASATITGLRTMATDTGAVNSQMSNAPLVFNGADANAATAIENGIRTLAANIPLDMSAVAADVAQPGETVDAVAAFVDHLETLQLGTPMCANGLNDIDTNADTFDDAYVDVRAGTPVCWKLIPKINTTVPATTSPQLFRATIEVIGDGVTTLDTRDVFFLVPPEPIDEPIG